MAPSMFHIMGKWNPTEIYRAPSWWRKVDQIPEKLPIESDPSFEVKTISLLHLSKIILEKQPEFLEPKGILLIRWRPFDIVDVDFALFVYPDLEVVAHFSKDGKLDAFSILAEVQTVQGKSFIASIYAKGDEKKSLLLLQNAYEKSVQLKAVLFCYSFYGGWEHFYPTPPSHVCTLFEIKPIEAKL